jgi:putative ubiquitin-RnfH superfamily antitoxin RatB of RatAB toxin-antitoxin module
MQLPSGSLLIDALRESALLLGLPDVEVDAMQTAVWGRKCLPAHVLQDGDRVELLRPLKVDPKVARRERFSRQGVGTTGLFSKRRAGAKSGY